MNYAHADVYINDASNDGDSAACKSVSMKQFMHLLSHSMRTMHHIAGFHDGAPFRIAWLTVPSPILCHVFIYVVARG